MNYRADLREAIARELSRGSGDFGGELIEAKDLRDVQVRWDDGDRYDPTYGDSPNSPPTFEVEITYANAVGDIRTKILDTAFTFTALLRMVLGVGDVLSHR